MLQLTRSGLLRGSATQSAVIAFLKLLGCQDEGTATDGGSRSVCTCALGRGASTKPIATNQLSDLFGAVQTADLRYARSFSKAAKGGKGKHAKTDQRTEQHEAAAAVEVDMTAYEDLLTKAVEHLQKELSGVRTGRANPGLIEHIVVNAHGEHVPLKACGTVVVRDNNSLAVSLYDESLRGSVETALKQSALGLNPAFENGELLVSIPRTSAEMRNKLVRLIHDEMEEARISIRHARQKAVDQCKQMGGGENEKKRAMQQVQKLHDKYVQEVDRIGQLKEKELLKSL